VDAAALHSGLHAVSTAAAGFAGVTALAIAELSTTGALDACTICLLRRGLFLSAAMVYERDQDVWVPSGLHAVSTAAAGFADVAALAIAGLSTTGAFAACMSCLLRRGLFMRAAAVYERDQDAWMQQSCSATPARWCSTLFAPLYAETLRIRIAVIYWLRLRLSSMMLMNLLCRSAGELLITRYSCATH
jgi:hypothetical protein